MGSFSSKQLFMPDMVMPDPATASPAEITALLAPLYASDYPLWTDNFVPKMQTPYIEQWADA